VTRLTPGRQSDRGAIIFDPSGVAHLRFLGPVGTAGVFQQPVSGSSAGCRCYVRRFFAGSVRLLPANRGSLPFPPYNAPRLGIGVKVSQFQNSTPTVVSICRARVSQESAKERITPRRPDGTGVFDKGRKDAKRLGSES